MNPGADPFRRDLQALGARGRRGLSRPLVYNEIDMRTRPTFRTMQQREERERQSWRFFASSVFFHALIIFLVISDWTHLSIPDSRRPGDDGPRGGGGGGGAARVTHIVLPAYQPPEQARPTEHSEERPEDIVIPVPTIAQVDIETPEFEIPRETAPLPGAEVLGQGAGMGGGAGAGTGSGGGVGSGRGTGIGDAVGPGTGGDGGDVFPPAPRYLTLPPQPTPRSVRGKTYVVRFTVTADGRVLRVDLEPRIRDGRYRRRLMDRLATWTFAPAVTRDGTPVAGVAIVEISL